MSKITSKKNELSSGGLNELFQRLLFVLIGILVFRFGSYIPVPGLNPERLADFFHGKGNGILGMFNMFSGGALSRMTIFALGVMPYISSSIVVQMYSSISPRLIALKKEGEAGRKKITQYTRYGTLFLSFIQGTFISKWLVSSKIAFYGGFNFYFVCIITLVTGTMFLMWLGEQMTERGIGNGISLIIFSGIVARFPSAFGEIITQVNNGQMQALTMIFVVALIFCVTIVVVYVERAQRRIPLTHAKQKGRSNSYIPMKINSSGVIPPIFAQAILVFFSSIPSFLGLTKGMGWLSVVFLAIQPGRPVYMLLQAALVIFFAFFYTALTFDSKDIAKQVQSRGGFIPGIRPGEQTANYLDSIMTRLTAFGAIYLALVALLPEFLIMGFHVPFYFGGTSLLIVVVVLMDFIAQFQTYLISNNYSNLLNDTRRKGSKRGLIR